MLRFLLTPRWLGLLLVVAVLGYACVRLSGWQFHRYQERKDSNDLVRTNLSAAPVPVSSLLRLDGEPGSAVEWRSVTATGHYDASHQLAVLYRTNNGTPGVDVVTPFVTDAGPAVLVDRGWMQTAANGNTTLHLPPPASGQVTVTGRVRIDSDGGSDEVTPSQGSVRAISSVAIEKTLPYPVYDGFLSLTKETPPSPHAPEKAGDPDLGSGPSYFYGWQWLFFAFLFFGFWIYFAWAEYQEKVKGRPRGRRPGPPAPRRDVPARGPSAVLEPSTPRPAPSNRPDGAEATTSDGRAHESQQPRSG